VTPVKECLGIATAAAASIQDVGHNRQLRWNASCKADMSTAIVEAKKVRAFRL
jgi:hypothetical protein